MTIYSSWDNFPTKLRPSHADTKFNGEAGLPHSEIVGSKLAHSSPTLIAACHVLHRLCMPRHPPIALTSRLRIHITNDRFGTRCRRDAGSAPEVLQPRALPVALRIKSGALQIGRASCRERV